MCCCIYLRYSGFSNKSFLRAHLVATNSCITRWIRNKLLGQAASLSALACCRLSFGASVADKLRVKLVPESKIDMKKSVAISKPKKPTHRSAGAPAESASAFIDAKIKELGDWRGKTLAHVRELIHQADPDIQEEWKWMGTPVWSHDGIVCTGESYKQVVKLTFARGASLKDPMKLFNSSLEGNTRRAIDIREGEKINEKALKALIREAVTLNTSKAKR